MGMLQVAAPAMALPKPTDARSTLPTNPNGRHWRERDPKELQGLVLHQELGEGSLEAVARYHTGAQSHLVSGGTESIAYTWGIRKTGEIALCVDFDKAVWSQGYRERGGDENKEFMSVMMEGLFTGPHVTDPSAHEPTHEQLIAVVVLWRVCATVWEWREDGLYGHYHFGKASCPGYAGQALIETFRRAPYHTPPPPPERDLTTAYGRQIALGQLGYNTGGADGIWGALSKGALIKFQQAVKLVPDGVWGKLTERAVLVALQKLKD